MASTTSSLPPDVSSLRAAALMTLRSKPRSRQLPISPNKQTSPGYLDDNSSVASTRRAGKSPELDYGSDDGIADAEGSTEEEEQDSGEKEEGEISEDEAPPPKPPPAVAMAIDEEPVPGLTSSSNRRILDSDSSNSSTMRKSSSASVTGGGSVGVVRPNVARLSSSASRAADSSTQSIEPRIRISSSTKPPAPATRFPTSLSLFHQSSRPVSSVNAVVTESKIKHTERGSSINLTTTTKSNHVTPVSVTQTAPMIGDVEVDPRAFGRPSMRMSAEEFAEAKTIILDLLGWGVPSEYFVNCGLSREAIYYAFTELNLKLPENLDTKGIVPYGPSRDSGALSTAPLVQTQGAVSLMRTHTSNPLGWSSTMGSNGQTTALGSTSFISTSQHPSFSRPTVVTHSTDLNIEHNKLSGQIESPKGPLSSEGVLSKGKWPLSPNDPIPGLQGHLFASSLTASSNSTILATDAPKHGYVGNLDEIETLRRKELLARKAVLASRKRKAAASSSKNSSPNPLDAGPSQLQPVPAETVDKFLKSITSDPVSTQTSDPSGLSRISMTVDSMEVDSETQPLTSDKSRSAAWSNPLRTGTPPNSEPQWPIPSRRSALKRPVASDFVDFDGSPRASPKPSSAQSSDVGNRPSLSSSLSFANLAPTRKVVIDFSDTEEEEDVVDHVHKDSPAALTPGGQTTVLGLSPVTSNGTATPEGGIVTPKITPDMLLKKELEIRRMKLLIAERERNSRLKKSANSTSATPPPIALSIAATTNKFSVSQDDDPNKQAEVPASPRVDERNDGMQDIDVSGTTVTDVTTQVTDVSSSEPANDGDDEGEPYSDQLTIP